MKNFILLLLVLILSGCSTVNKYEMRVMDSKVKWCMESINKIRVFINMPNPPEPLEKE